MTQRVVAGLAVLVMMACAAPRASSKDGSIMVASADSQLDEERDDVTCGMEMPTGSHIRRSVCRSAAEVNAKRLATQDSMRFLRSPVLRRGGTVVDDFDMVVTPVHSP